MRFAAWGNNRAGHGHIDLVPSPMKSATHSDSSISLDCCTRCVENDDLTMMNRPDRVAPRVLFVSHAKELGGAEFILLDVMRGFVDSSAVWLFEDGPFRARLDAQGIRTVIPRRPYDFSRIKRERTLLHALPMVRGLAAIPMEMAEAAHHYDIIYANSQKAFVLGIIAAKIARRPLVWHLHDILTREHFGGQQLWLTTRLANRFVSRVIVPSSTAANAFTAAGGKQSLICLVPNGISLEEDDNDSTIVDRLTLRTRLALPQGFLFGVFSRLAPWKGQHVALQALARLPDASCLIVGGPLFGEHDYADELIRLASNLGIEARVHFLGHRNDVLQLMRAVDIVVHPSVKPESFGRTLVEAMLSRTPIIATDSGAASEILGSGAAGVLVMPNNPKMLAEAVEMLRAEPVLVSHLVEAAEKRARDSFSAHRMRTDIEKLILDVMDWSSPQ
jgi:glycosyltransferase involved in cell wall biosynthesis